MRTSSIFVAAFVTLVASPAIAAPFFVPAGQLSARGGTGNAVYSARPYWKERREQAWQNVPSPDAAQPSPTDSSAAGGPPPAPSPATPGSGSPSLPPFTIGVDHMPNYAAPQQSGGTQQPAPTPTSQPDGQSDDSNPSPQATQPPNQPPQSHDSHPHPGHHWGRPAWGSHHGDHRGGHHKRELLELLVRALENEQEN
ncbi:hypothetical protein EIP91_006760 [Steccherinum ochraceum]|uniref:Uncharacterized protein n=1 Tax=Steccherinum ochraceum TaxID=92696 RepID=A0A4R0R7X5_9APHY|nr:hypothetical protein EIP91_006760 [Steccherinum ochraceum]